MGEGTEDKVPGSKAMLPAQGTSRHIGKLAPPIVATHIKTPELIQRKMDIVDPVNHYTIDMLQIHPRVNNDFQEMQIATYAPNEVLSQDKVDLKSIKQYATNATEMDAEQKAYAREHLVPQVMEMLARNGGMKIFITGKTDGTGTAEVNKVISQARADNFYQFLHDEAVLYADAHKMPKHLIEGLVKGEATGHNLAKSTGTANGEQRGIEISAVTYKVPGMQIEINHDTDAKLGQSTAVPMVIDGGKGPLARSRFKQENAESPSDEASTIVLFDRVGADSMPVNPVKLKMYFDHPNEHVGFAVRTNKGTEELIATQTAGNRLQLKFDGRMLATIEIVGTQANGLTPEGKLPDVSQVSVRMAQRNNQLLEMLPVNSLASHFSDFTKQNGIKAENTKLTIGNNPLPGQFAGKPQQLRDQTPVPGNF